jgi:hypothetical protein
VLALGPWFSANVSPWLLTTRALATLEAIVPNREQQQQQHVVYQTLAPAYYPGSTIPAGGWTGGTGWGWPQSIQGYITTTVPTTSALAGPTTFVAIGHWLFAAVAAAVGAGAAAWISRRGRQRADLPASAGDNPFAEPEK